MYIYVPIYVFRSHGLEDSRHEHGGFELDAPNGSKCFKLAPFYVEESHGHLGVGRCQVCCSVLQRVAVSWSVLHCVAVYERLKAVPSYVKEGHGPLGAGRCQLCCSVMQYVAACRRVLQCGVESCSVFQCIVVCCSVLQCAWVKGCCGLATSKVKGSYATSVFTSTCVAVCRRLLQYESVQK